MTDLASQQDQYSVRELTALSELNHARLYARRAQELTADLSTIKGPETLDRLDRQIGNIVIAFNRAADSQQLNQPEIAQSIVMCLYDYYDLRGKWDDWLLIARKGLQITETIDDSYSRGVAIPAICNTLGIAYRMIGRADEAFDWYQKALQSATSDDIRSDTLTNLADIHRLKGNPEEACECAEEAIRYAENCGDINREAKGYEYLGLSFTSLQNYHGAIAAYDRGLQLRRQSGNLRRLSLTLTFKAYALTMRGDQADLEEAQRCYEEAREIDMRLKNEQSLARYQGDIAALYNRLGRYQEAIESGTEALSVNKRIGFRRGTALNFVRLMDSYLNLGDLDEALAAANQAFEMHNELTDFDFRMVSFEFGLVRLSQALHQQGYGEAAQRVATMAIEVGTRTGSLERIRSQLASPTS